MIQLDNLHYDFRSIDGFNKPFNFIMSPRELGKSSMFWLKKIYWPWKQDFRPWIYLVRNVVEITEALILTIQDSILNKFTDDNVIFTYSKQQFKDGIVDVKIGDKILFRLIALSINSRRVKQALLKNVKGVLFDEYIINQRIGERYLSGEAFKFKDAYTTWRRECSGVLKCYFLGNPYSLYNPMFMDWNVAVNKLRKNDFYIGQEYVIHWAVLSDELKSKLKELNPLYRFDEEFSEYAQEGNAIHDSNIKLGKLENNFELKFVVKIDADYLGIFYNKEYTEIKYHVKILDEVSAKRTIYCFDFESMMSHSQIMDIEDRLRFQNFKNALRVQAVTFNDVNAYYLTMEVYKNI